MHAKVRLASAGSTRDIAIDMAMAWQCDQSLAPLPEEEGQTELGRDDSMEVAPKCALPKIVVLGPLR